MSVDLYNQHTAISELQQTEEEMVEQHRTINEFLSHFLPESRALYNTTNYVEYDQDGEYHLMFSLVPQFISLLIVL